MENFNENGLNRSQIMRKYYKPEYSNLFKKIKDVKAKIPVKNEILKAMLDGKWHAGTDLVRAAKKEQYMGVVTLGTMVNSLNMLIQTNYLEKKSLNGEMFYKISDNYVGLTRAAYNRYRIS